MKRWVISLLLGLLVFTSCETMQVNKHRKLYEKHLKERLKDPESFVVYNETYTNFGSFIDWEVDYGAKNSFGGNVRTTVKLSTYENGSVYIKSEY